MTHLVRKAVYSVPRVYSVCLCPPRAVPSETVQCGSGVWVAIGVRDCVLGCGSGGDGGDLEEKQQQVT